MAQPKTIIKQVGNTEIKAVYWTKGGKRRLYFSELNVGKVSGKACWDIVRQEWIKVRHEFGPRFKTKLEFVFDLKQAGATTEKDLI
jgi:hypothetical protein